MAQIDETLLQNMTSRLVRTFQPKESSERPLQRVRRACACVGDVRVALDIFVRTRAEADKYRHLYASLECQIFEKGRILYEQN